MSDILLTDNEWLEPLRDDLIRGEHAAATEAIMRQKRIAAAEMQIRRCTMEGIGELEARMDADIFHRFGGMYGYDCFSDDSFWEDTFKKSPEVRIKSTPRKTTLVVDGFRK